MDSTPSNSLFAYPSRRSVAGGARLEEEGHVHVISENARFVDPGIDAEPGALDDILGSKTSYGLVRH